MREVLGRAAGWVRRLKPAEFVGLYLLAGLVVVGVAVSVFAVIADAVHTEPEFAAADLALTRGVHGLARPWLTRVVWVLTELGAPWFVFSAALAGAAWLVRVRLRFAAGALLCSVFLGLGLNLVLKHLFERARPLFEQPLVAAGGYSFPSGHVAGATLLYGFAAVLIARRGRGWQRVLGPLAAVVLVGVVCFTRVYLGVHYASDVAAAVAVACSWVAVCVTTFETLRRWRGFR